MDIPGTMLEELSAFAAEYPRRTFVQDELLIMQGDVLPSLFVVISGFIKVTDIADNGTEQLVWLAKRYDIVPLEWLTDAQLPAPFFYTAFAETEVFEIPIRDFRTFIYNRPDILRFIVSALVDKQRHVMQLLNAVNKPDARQKLAYTLGYLVERFGDSDKPVNTVHLPLTHQSLASVTGLSRKTTSIELKKLKDEGYVAYDQQVFTVDTTRLKELVGS